MSLLERRVFWAWYYRLNELPEAPPRVVVFEDERIEVPGGTSDFIFTPEEDVVQFERRLLQERAEFSLPFRGGFTWRIRCRDLGHSHSLEHASWREPLSLGHADPHSALPILRVTEVETLANALVSSSPISAMHAAMLLLAVADFREEGMERTTALATARVWNGGPLAPEKLELLGRALMPQSQSDLDPPEIHRWQRDEGRGWVTTAPHSRRNPNNQRWVEENGFEKFELFLQHAELRSRDPALDRR